MIMSGDTGSSEMEMRRQTHRDGCKECSDMLIADGDTGICIVEAHRHRFRDAYGCS